MVSGKKSHIGTEMNYIHFHHDSKHINKIVIPQDEHFSSNAKVIWDLPVQIPKGTMGTKEGLTY